MTVRAPSWIQAGSYSADNDRLLLQSLLGGTPNQALTQGVVGLADYKVTQSGTPSMILKVASGSAWIVGTQSATEGVMNVVNDDNTATVIISTANATNPRIDLVVLQGRNAEYSGVNNDAILTVITGTPAGSPVAPALPADALLLAQIAVAAGAGSIMTANITDKRAFFSPLNLQRAVPAGRIWGAGGQNITNALATAVTLGSTSFLRGGMTVSGSSLVVPVSGIYAVSAGVTMAGASGILACQVTVAGVFVANAQLPLNGADVEAVASDDILITAGQAIALNVFQSSGGTLATYNGGSPYIYLSATLVSV